MKELKISDIHAREVLDSRGNPTIEARVTLENEFTGTEMVPSGASTGQYEAVELRDAMCEATEWGERYNGKGVLQAVKNINTIIHENLVGKNALNQPLIDQMLVEMDGTENKSRLGANALLAVSLANAKACAIAKKLPLYQYLGGCNAKRLPVPMMNILNGGVHAANTVDFQEFMIMPVGAQSFADGLRMGTEIYHCLEKILKEKGLTTAVGDEGGFAPDLKDAFEVLDYLTEAVEKAGYRCGKDIVFAIDAAASELHEENSGMYYFPGESKVIAKIHGEEEKIPDTKRSGVVRSTEEMIALYSKLCDKYPIRSIEDGLDEEDWEGWKQLTDKLGKRVQLVGDDLFVTNTKRLSKGIASQTANAILVKVNQIGTLTEAMDAVSMAMHAGYKAVISHRSGETEDTTIADLSVACNAGQIKTGAPCRSDRVSKYNRLLAIEEDLTLVSRYQCPFCKV
ncbi:MAG TPA: phosphopyruvate hydratase [Lachnospiraceae bacterium]|nr:phosphopyruvate hydratase [Lachnospiraceae bacterium]